MSSSKLLEQSRLKPNAFIRQRTLTFPVLLVAMISGFKASAQAFSKARKHFSHTAFPNLNQHLLQLVSCHWPIPRWRGLRVVAADASKMRMFLQDASRRLVREVIAFALYLPGIDMSLVASLYDASVGERQMLFEHLHHLAADDLLVLDRGYPARWLIAYLSQRGIQFCMRVDQTGFSAAQAFLRSGASEQLVTIGKPKALDCRDYGCQSTTTAVRLIRVVTPNGRIYVLMTSLFDSHAYPAADFASLYHSRRGVAIFVTAFSGLLLEKATKT